MMKNMIFAKMLVHTALISHSQEFPLLFCLLYRLFFRAHERVLALCSWTWSNVAPLWTLCFGNLRYDPPLSVLLLRWSDSVQLAQGTNWSGSVIPQLDDISGPLDPIISCPNIPEKVPRACARGSSSPFSWGLFPKERRRLRFYQRAWRWRSRKG